MRLINRLIERQYYSMQCIRRLEAALEDWNVEKILKVLPLLIPIFKITTWFKMTFSKET